MRRKARYLSFLLALCLLLSGCGDGEAPEIGEPSRQNDYSYAPPGGEAAPLIDAPPGGDPAPSYRALPIALSAFNPKQAEGNGSAMIDISSVSDGYVAVSALSEQRLKFQVLKDDVTYNYDIASDRTPSVFPLQSGSGHYTFRVMENISENKYAQMYAVDCDVELTDEFQPFLRPSDYAPYDADSQCVKAAADLASGCAGRLELIGAVYEFVCYRVDYDNEKAISVTSGRTGYMPDPDETLATGKGICFDYASLAAAMLRSQGIPTKIIFGYVSPDNLYHAWNMFYTEESGWVTVSFKVDSGSWNRIDLTFSDGGASDEFVGDGSHYTDVYFY